MLSVRSVDGVLVSAVAPMAAGWADPFHVPHVYAVRASDEFLAGLEA